jgi:hypothetical protein
VLCPRRFGAAVIFMSALAGLPILAAAQATPAPAPSPSASPPAGPSDPCASLSSLVSRPTFGTSPCSVKSGDLLSENGYTNLTTSGSGAGNLVSYPQSAVRVGLGGNLELDLLPPSYQALSGHPATTGWSDTQVGIKYEFGYSSRWLYGVNTLLTINTGTPAFTSNGLGITANFNCAYTLSPAVGLFATFGYNALSAGTAAAPLRFQSFNPSAGISASLPQGFNVFAEGFGQSSTGPGLGGRFGYDGGFSKDVGSRLQLDVNYFNYAAQFGAHAHSVGFGASYLVGK